MRLILIRHGETKANLVMRWSGSKDLEITDLTAKGKSQAKKLALKTFGYYLLTTFFAVILGLFLVMQIKKRQ